MSPAVTLQVVLCCAGAPLLQAAPTDGQTSARAAAGPVAAETASHETAPSGIARSETDTAPDWLDNYGAAYRQAERASKLLLIWFAGADGDLADKRHLEAWTQPDIRRRLDRYVLVRVTTRDEWTEGEKTVPLVKHPAFADLHGQPGIAIVDLSDPASPHFRDVVSILPARPGMAVPADELAVLLDLPVGTLTQRTLIFAVRTHGERPRSASGDCLALLATEAERHATLQASLQLQGHHHWDQRFYRLNDQLPQGLVAQEVCAESWPGQSLMDAARECVHSWRQSSGHWSAVRTAHPVFGYDMKRGRNGVWYATGVFGTRR